MVLKRSHITLYFQVLEMNLRIITQLYFEYLTQLYKYFHVGKLASQEEVKFETYSGVELGF